MLGKVSIIDLVTLFKSEIDRVSIDIRLDCQLLVLHVGTIAVLGHPVHEGTEMTSDGLHIVVGVLDRWLLVNVELTIPVIMLIIVDVLVLDILIEVVEIIYCEGVGVEIEVFLTFKLSLEQLIAT